mmetsp:Transcript_21429/g.23969  ORF Transcript_21429/g.23969 Transcript_21429/m.23969 type:complete len:81 (+) Transcript_21429:362-604(+)
MEEFGSMLGIKGSSHNMEVGMNVLVQERIMEVSKNDINQDVFWNCCKHQTITDYRDQDEDEIKRQLKVTARAAKLNANDR